MTQQTAARARATLAAGFELPASQLRDLTRTLLLQLAAKAPGRAIEVRIPPYGVTQCGAGPVHRRGTPPNVVETDPTTWVSLALGVLTWADATAQGRVAASGSRADLDDYLPLA